MKLVVCLGALLSGRLPGGPRPDLRHSAYIWQRDWSAPVADAVLREKSEVDGLTVLLAEFYPGTPGKTVSVNVDFEALKRSGAPVTLAFRVNGNPAVDVGKTFGPEWVRQVSNRVALAHKHALEIAALEIDFDCPTSKLDAYAAALTDLRAQFGGTLLSITVLPTWMSRPEAFQKLVAAADRFVLQVHSIKRPRDIDDRVKLCDPAEARQWMEAAARFGKPFDVALPTYAYRLGFDEQGALVDVSGEDASGVLHAKRRYRVVRAEPREMAELVRAITTARPALCGGVIWYRLPIGNEGYNWDPGTWRAVKAGRLDDQSWELEMSPRPNGVWEVNIRHNSEMAMLPPENIRVSWSVGRALAWDGQRNYEVKATSEEALLWSWPERMEAPLLPRGTQWTVGWLRMDGTPEWNASIGDPHDE